MNSPPATGRREPTESINAGVMTSPLSEEQGMPVAALDRGRRRPLAEAIACTVRDTSSVGYWDAVRATRPSRPRFSPERAFRCRYGNSKIALSNVYIVLFSFSLSGHAITENQGLRGYEVGNPEREAGNPSTRAWHSRVSQHVDHDGRSHDLVPALWVTPIPPPALQGITYPWPSASYLHAVRSATAIMRE